VLRVLELLRQDEWIVDRKDTKDSFAVWKEGHKGKEEGTRERSDFSPRLDAEAKYAGVRNDNVTLLLRLEEMLRSNNPVLPGPPG